MPYASIDNTLQMYYELDDYTDPWKKPETIVLLHGISKNSRHWYAWPPLLARKYRVVRPDTRGMGKSTVPPEGRKWSMTGFAHDLRTLLKRLEIGRAHLVADTFGGPISLQFAYEYPELVSSLTICGPVYTFAGQDKHLADGQREVREHGVSVWAKNGAVRVFGKFNDTELAKWYAEEMGKTSRHTILTLQEFVLNVDLTSILPVIRTPTLLLAGGDSEISPGNRIAEMGRLMPHAKVVLFPDTPNNIHALIPEKCVHELRQFLGGLQK